jgi:hypothetical protein
VKLSAKSIASLKKQAAKSGTTVTVYGYQEKLVKGKKTISSNRAKAIAAQLKKFNKNFKVRVVAAGSTKVAQCKTQKYNCGIVVFSAK